MDTAQLTPRKLETIKVASLTDERERWKIRVKVRSKGEKLVSQNGIKYLKFVLEDDSGIIEALAFGSQDVKRFDDKLEENKVYFISDGRLTEVDKSYYSNVKHAYQLQLRLETAVTLCEDTVNQSPVRHLHTDGSNWLCVTNQQTPGLSQCDVTNQQTPGLSQCDVTNQQTPGLSQCSITSQHVPGFSGYGDTGQCTPVRNQHVEASPHKPGHTPGHTPGTNHCHNGSTYTPVTKLSQSDKSVVDVVGKVTGVWKLEKKYTDLRRINITDEYGSDVTVELWNRQAVEFSVRCIDSVIALKNVRVKKMNGETELQSTPTTVIDYNPSDPEAEGLKEIMDVDDSNNISTSDNVGNSQNLGSSCSECDTNINNASSSGCSNSCSKRSESKAVGSSGRGRGRGRVRSVQGSGSTGGSRGKSKAVRGRGIGKRNESSTISVSSGRGKRGKSSRGSSVGRNGRKKPTGKGAERGGTKNRAGTTQSGRGRLSQTRATGAGGGDEDDDDDDDDFIDDDDDFIDDDDDDADEEEDSETEDDDLDDFQEDSVKKLRPRRRCLSFNLNFTEGGDIRKSASSNCYDDDEEEEEERDKRPRTRGRRSLKLGGSSKDAAAEEEDVDDDDGDKEVEKERRPRTRSRSVNIDLTGDDDEDGIENEEVEGEKEETISISAVKQLADSLTRPRRKSRQKSLGHQDNAYSLQVTPVESDNDLGEENEEQVIKPVSSAKKTNKVASSDSEDSDATLSNTASPSKSATPCSSGKRSHHSDDDSDAECDNEKGLTESAKKRFKRIKEVKDSQNETNQLEEAEDTEVYNENNDTEGESGSDTSTSQSDSEANDSDWIEEGPDENRDLIEEFMDMKKDTSGTKQLLRCYIWWMTMLAGGESVDSEEHGDVLDSKRKLEGRLEVAMGICQSQAWGADFREDVRMYPEFVKDSTHDELPDGDFRKLEKCQVCNREDHPWSVLVSLTGKPYNKKTYEVEEVDDDDEDFLPVQYHMGCFCHPRTKLFHNLYHFGYHLYQRCKEMLEVQTIDQVATDSSLLNQMYDKVTNWMQEVEIYYTMDGKRANSKWKREYDGF